MVSNDVSFLDDINFNSDGLIPAIAQDSVTGKVLMMAWMNRDAVAATVAEGRAVYWSRSRRALWRKGESSGNVQRLVNLRLDCDADTLLLEVEQVGGIACHTGREHCFFRTLRDERWDTTEPVLKSPESIYGNDGNG